jgi:phosphatidylglycerol:prolipoprotein diacylglycerol transferase
MSFPYVTDVVNAVFGTRWHLPVPVFGIVVLAAVFLSTLLFGKEVARREQLGVVPAGTGSLVTDLVFVAVITGILGAKVFHLLEYTDEVLDHPASMIFSRNGFSIYGGLCFGTVAAIFCLVRRRVPVLPMLDAAAPAMMLELRRRAVGSAISDGDWGVAADLALKPSWLPDWLWAQTYENNIAGVTIAAPGSPTALQTAMALVWQLCGRCDRIGTARASSSPSISSSRASNDC